MRQLEFRVDRAEAPPATKYERRAGAVLPPEASGGAAVFLCSRAADYVQGHILAVDGGWLAR